MCAAALMFGLAGCAQHTWAPGPQAAGTFGQVSGQCKLLAISGGGGGGFVGASGSPKFVGAVVGSSILAGAVGSAIQQNKIFNACMEAQGFEVADNSSPMTAQRPPDARFDPTMNVAQDSPTMAAYRACYPLSSTAGFPYIECMKKHGMCLSLKNTYESCPS
jgi:hypothetical protein